jgi:hypothetical protein
MNLNVDIVDMNISGVEKKNTFVDKNTVGSNAIMYGQAVGNDANDEYVRGQ